MEKQLLYCKVPLGANELELTITGSDKLEGEDYEALLAFVELFKQQVARRPGIRPPSTDIPKGPFQFSEPQSFVGGSFPMPGLHSSEGDRFVGTSVADLVERYHDPSPGVIIAAREAMKEARDLASTSQESADRKVTELDLRVIFDKDGGLQPADLAQLISNKLGGAATPEVINLICREIASYTPGPEGIEKL